MRERGSKEGREGRREGRREGGREEGREGKGSTNLSQAWQAGSHRAGAARPSSRAAAPVASPHAPAASGLRDRARREEPEEWGGGKAIGMVCVHRGWVVVWCMSWTCIRGSSITSPPSALPTSLPPSLLPPEKPATSPAARCCSFHPLFLPNNNGGRRGGGLGVCSPCS